MILGIDVDGCLADFNNAYRQRLIDVTGRALIPMPFEPSTWFYATEEFGYTKDEDRATWKSITADGEFWYSLDPLPGAAGLLAALEDLRREGSEIYFLTNRPGVFAKTQTEEWLEAHGFFGPTVVIARGEKGLFARCTEMTHFLDDRPENCFSVKETHPNCRVVMPKYRYNEWAWLGAIGSGIEVVSSVNEFIEMLEGVIE